MGHEKDCCEKLPHTMEVKTCSDCNSDEGQCKDGYCHKCATRLGICAHCGSWIEPTS